MLYSCGIVQITGGCRAGSYPSQRLISYTQRMTISYIHTEDGRKMRWTTGGYAYNLTSGDDDDDDPLDPGPYGHCFLASTDRVKHVMTPRGMRSITIPKSHREAMASPYAEEWKKAEMKELDTISEMHAIPSTVPCRERSRQKHHQAPHRKS